jgi:DUF971 family protein
MPHPVNLENLAHSAQLRIEWDSGQVALISHARLRAACRCAACRSALLAGGDLPELTSNVHLIEIEPVGWYAVQLVFDDGHDRGIYPWAYLFELTSTS